jgi:transposase-like protein
VPDYPQTVLEFSERFHTEAACRAYLETKRWPQGARCPRCPQAKVWTMKPPFYRCGACGHDFTVTAGTLFADTHLPLRLWFQAMWYVVNQKHGASALGVQRVLGLGSYRTAWNWLHKLRRAMVRPGRDQLAGAVEVDEVYLGGVRAGKRGRGAAGKALGLIMAQVEGGRIGRIRLARVGNASAPVLGQALAASVASGSQVLTDGWSGYADLPTLGFQHAVVRHTAVVGGKSAAPR